jgi:uncharacterized protein (TIGR02453 family)
MLRAPAFNGFTPQTLSFYRELARNNNKTWFDQNRELYENEVMTPARQFVAAMGKKFGRSAPRLQADPRVNKSIFRIYRDTRFSADKSPYKTHLGIWLWEGNGPRMECSGFYLQVESHQLYLGVGIYMFPKWLLEPYHDAIVDPQRGKELRRAIKRCLKVDSCELGGKHYKRTPRGYDTEHPNADLLRHNGLYAGVQLPIPKAFYTRRLVDLCHRYYRGLLPLHRWLLALTHDARG